MQYHPAQNTQRERKRISSFVDRRKNLCHLSVIKFKPHYCDKPRLGSLFPPPPPSLIKLKAASRLFWLLIKQNHSQIAMVPHSREPTPRAAAVRDSCSPALRVVLGETRSPGRIQWNKENWRAAFSHNWLKGFTQFSQDESSTSNQNVLSRKISI